MIKKVAAVIVLIIVASLFFAGCTFPISGPSPTPTQTQSPTVTTQHDAFLENLLAAVKKQDYSNSSLSVKAWQVTWINSTAVRLQETVKDIPSNVTWAHDITYMVFPASQDATNYLNAMNLTAYSLASTVYPGGGPYPIATGHAPQIYKVYSWYDGNPSNITEYKYHEISQADNSIVVATAKRL